MDSPGEPADFSLSNLASQTAVHSHAQLSKLLKLLPQKDDAERKRLLLQYAIQTRHTMARLLATVRWFKGSGSLLEKASIVEEIAYTQSQLYEDIADSLWTSKRAQNTISTRRPAVASAVNVLTSPNVPTSNPPPTSHHHHTPYPSKPDNHYTTSLLPSEVSDVTQHFAHSSSPYQNRHTHPQSSSLGSASPSIPDRLALATRNSIRESLLHVGPLVVQSWRAGLSDVCVQVGIDNLWSAHVSLDSLDPDTALLRVHSVQIHLANHPDAPGTLPPSPPIHPPSKKPASTGTASSSQHTVLRTMANQRIVSALNAARAFADPNPPLHTTTIALCALRDLMMHDVCAPLSMAFLRAQAIALCNGPWYSFLQFDGANATTSRCTPLSIRYWGDHPHPASICIAEYQPPVTHEGSSDAPSDPDIPALVDRLDVSKPMVITCVHDPPLPTGVELGEPSVPVELRMNALNLEQIILSAIRSRIRARLNALTQAFTSRHVQLRLHPSCICLRQNHKRGAANGAPQSADVLQIQAATGDSSHGIDIRIFTMTGGTRVRPYGAAALDLPARHTPGQPGMWTGSKHFKSKAEEAEAVIAAFEIVRARVKLNSAARSVCALDIGVSNTLPPGTASVAATQSPERAASQLVPPFAPLERRAPRRFLTLSPPPSSRDFLQSGGWMSHPRSRSSGSRGLDRPGPTKRPRLTYATTSDALVFIQESSFAGEDWFVGERSQKTDRYSGNDNSRASSSRQKHQVNEADSVDRYNGTAAAAAAWAVTREIVERRLRRDSLLRAFVASNVASAAQMHHTRSTEGGDLHLDSASRILLKVKCEPLPVRRAELLLRGYDAWQVRLSLLPSIFDNTDCVPAASDEKRGGDGEKDFSAVGNLWSVGVASNGSQLTFTYPSANTETVRSFFRDLTRARTAAALARGVPVSRFYQVLRRSPVRILVGIGPYGYETGENGNVVTQRRKPLYTATVEYVYSKGNSGGFSLSFSPPKHTMAQLSPLIEEALDLSGGQVGGILAGLFERACPMAVAAETAVRVRGNGRVRFVTALRVRAMFAGAPKASKGNESAGKGSSGNGTPMVHHALDMDARGGSGMVTVIDVGRATSVMIQQGLAHGKSSGASQRRTDFASVPKWNEIVASLTRSGHAEAQRAGSTVVLRMEMLEILLSRLVISANVENR